MSHDDDFSVFEVPSLLLTGAYLLTLVGWGALLWLLTRFWGDSLLMSYSDITNGDVSGAGLGSVSFIFLWALGATGFLLVIKGREHVYDTRLVRFFKGAWASLNAGIFEELIFRWLLFFIAMITLPFFNFITFGLLKWFYTTLLIPVANFCTFGALHPFLLGRGSWVMGAAIISVNADFRDGHKYLGLIGWVNSWFLGMVMFYVMLNYNLQTAIAAHVLYDLIIFGISAFPAGRMEHGLGSSP
jgi:hypothetical protein